MFPLNLEDRIKFINNNLNNLLNESINLNIKKASGGLFEGKRDDKYIKYIITFNHKVITIKNPIEELGFKLNNGK